jgi:flagellar basal body-associated protein FliL
VIVAILAIVVIVVIAGLTLYYFTMNNPTRKTIVTPTEKTTVIQPAEKTTSTNETISNSTPADGWYYLYHNFSTLILCTNQIITSMQR